MELSRQSANVSEITKALLSKAFIHASEQEIKTKCHMVIWKSLVFCGFKGSENDEVVAFQTLQLIGLIQKDFRTIRLDEIDLAFYYGVRQHFGAFMGMNAKTYYQFIKGYTEMEQRIEEKKKVIQIEENPVLSKDQKDSITLSFAKQYFEEYKLTGVAGYHFHYACDLLTEMYGEELNGKKTLVLNEQDRNDIKETSKKQYEAYVLGAAAEYKNHGMNKKAKEVQSVLENLKENQTYINHQKKNAVKYFFDKMIKEGTNL